MLIASTPIEGRKLRQIITALLKSGAAQKITRINYAKSYTLVENKLIKQEQKLLLISTDNAEKTKSMIQKQGGDFEYLPYSG